MGFVIGAIFAAAIILGYCFFHNKQTKHKNAIIEAEYAQRLIAEISNNVVAEKNRLIDERVSEHLRQATEDVSKQLKMVTDEFEARKTQIYQQLQCLENELSTAIANKNARIREITEELSRQSAVVATENTEKLNELKQQFLAAKEQIQSEFTTFSDEIAAKKETLQKELAAQEAKQKEIIEQYKRAEEIKEQENFYRIVLTDDEKEDVHKLRKMAEDLHDPTALYKLIYEQYYKRPFNELMGRIIGEDTSVGIYKITNIENGKCYIGQTKQEFKIRFLQHVKRGLKVEPSTKNKLYAAMWEDGVENFTFEILAHCEAEDLNTKEKEFISFYKANEWGYNTYTSAGS